MRTMTVSMLACALLAGAAFADDSTSSSATATADEPSATVDLTGGAVAAGIGYVWGNGNLIYKGKSHKFKLSGLSIVDVGIAHITASGVVYNLRDINDFNGNYIAVSAGLTVAGGGSAAVLRNEHGVVIKLLSTSEGLRFNLSGDGVGIKLQST
jgi:hypothetical protein